MCEVYITDKPGEIKLKKKATQNILAVSMVLYMTQCYDVKTVRKAHNTSLTLCERPFLSLQTQEEMTPMLSHVTIDYFILATLMARYRTRPEA